MVNMVFPCFSTSFPYFYVRISFCGVSYENDTKPQNSTSKVAISFRFVVCVHLHRAWRIPGTPQVVRPHLVMSHALPRVVLMDW